MGIDQFLGMFDFHRGDIIGQGAAGQFFKGIAQMAGADIQTVRDIGQGQLFHIMLVHIGPGLLHQLVGTGGFAVIQQAAELAAKALKPCQYIGQAVKLIEPPRHIDGVREDIAVAVVRALEIGIQIRIEIDACAGRLLLARLVFLKQGDDLFKDGRQLITVILRDRGG